MFKSRKCHRGRGGILSPLLFTIKLASGRYHACKSGQIGLHVEACDNFFVERELGMTKSRRILGNKPKKHAYCAFICEKGKNIFFF